MIIISYYREGNKRAAKRLWACVTPKTPLQTLAVTSDFKTLIT